MVFFIGRNFPNILKYRDHLWDLLTIWKQKLFRHLLKSSASIYESSGSQFSRTTTGIQSGPDAFHKTKFAVIFLTILGVTEILRSFRLFLEGKTGKKIPELSRSEFLEKFSANNFTLLDAEDNTSRLLNRRGIADLPLLRTLLAIRQKSREPSFWEVMDSFVLLAYASLAASRTLLQRLLACLNFTLESEDFSLWYKQKKWFLWAMTAAQAAENHGDEWGLTWYFWWVIYASIRS